MSTLTISNHAAAAKEIRTALKGAFPAVKFQVKADSFAGGDAVRISYTDGPKTEKVRNIVDKYQYGHFNGMEDIYEYSNGNADIPQVKYVQVQRDCSPETMAELLKEVQQKYAGCENLGMNDYFKEMGTYVSILVGRLHSEREF